ncbi:hypothetical protein DL93DRAFT_501835 [Clavulina sp. PMI_390]|nr:hypothetical protein DL93DRAFT_501835 [Clavulina sp. PMI_390]
MWLALVALRLEPADRGGHSIATTPPRAGFMVGSPRAGGRGGNTREVEDSYFLLIMDEHRRCHRPVITGKFLHKYTVDIMHDNGIAQCHASAK